MVTVLHPGTLIFIELVQILQMTSLGMVEFYMEFYR